MNKSGVVCGAAYLMMMTVRCAHTHIEMTMTYDAYRDDEETRELREKKQVEKNNDKITSNARTYWHLKVICNDTHSTQPCVIS